MTETVEGTASAKTKENEPRNDDKKPLKIRIALFFDGTLNNRMNIEEREADSEIYEENKSDDANSYDNGRTNIAIMEPHVSEKKEDYAGGYNFVYKAYIAGQGAITQGKDSMWGYALAVGSTGVPDRAEEGIERAFRLIKEDSENINSHKYYIKKLTIDVFGFSRGAATARYAIYVLFNGRIARIDDDTGEVIYEWNPLFQRLNAAGYDIDEKAVEVCFAGLFDTVLSYIGSQKLPGWMAANILKQKAVVHAKKALHLAAADEHRKDFPLHKISSAIKKGTGKEYYLPGVHSDVGGSYNKANELELEKETDESKKVYMETSDEGIDEPLTKHGMVKDHAMVINQAEPTRIKKDREDLIKQQWYKEDEIKSYDIAYDEMGNVITSILSVSRKGIRSAYCNIPLKIMAQHAREPDVKLKIDEKLEDRAQIILKPEKDLQELEGVIQNYIATSHHSKPGDWIEDNARLNNEKLKAIRHRHFHFSASKMSMGYAPRFEWDAGAWKFRRRRYYYDA